MCLRLWILGYTRSENRRMDMLLPFRGSGSERFTRRTPVVMRSSHTGQEVVVEVPASCRKSRHSQTRLINGSVHLGTLTGCCDVPSSWSWELIMQFERTFVPDLTGICYLLYQGREEMLGQPRERYCNVKKRPRKIRNNVAKFHWLNNVLWKDKPYE